MSKRKQSKATSGQKKKKQKKNGECEKKVEQIEFPRYMRPKFFTQLMLNGKRYNVIDKCNWFICYMQRYWKRDPKRALQSNVICDSCHRRNVIIELVKGRILHLPMNHVDEWHLLDVTGNTILCNLMNCTAEINFHIDLLGKKVDITACSILDCVNSVVSSLENIYGEGSEYALMNQKLISCFKENYSSLKLIKKIEFYY